MIVKVGDKKKHVSIPEGWLPVTSGQSKEGDKYLDMTVFPVIQWNTVREDWDEIGDPFDWFDLLIRDRSVA
jgi:hypothetical protein